MSNTCNVTSSKVLKFFGSIFLSLAIIFSLTNTTGEPRGLDDDIECGSLLSPGEDLEDKSATFYGRTIDADDFHPFSMDPENEYCDERRTSRKNQVILLAVIGTLTFAAGYFGFNYRNGKSVLNRTATGALGLLRGVTRSVTRKRVFITLGLILLGLTLILTFKPINTYETSYEVNDAKADCGSLTTPGSLSRDNPRCQSDFNTRMTIVVISGVLGILTLAVGIFSSKRSNENTSRRSGESYTEEPRADDQPRSSSATDMSANDSRVSNTRKEEPADNAETNFCSSCGTKVEPDDVFCSSCGKKLK